jgi:general secretion pathway protein A
VPRLINLVCDRALLAGYVQGTRVVHPGMVKQAAEEVLGGARRPRPRRSLYALGAGGALAAAVLALFLLPRTARAPAAPPLPAPSPAAVAAPPAAVAVSSTAPALDASRLESVVLSAPRGASLEAAVAAIRSLWGASALQRTPFRTNMEQVRRLDMPVVLEMYHPTRRDTCFVALLGVEGETALVAALNEAPMRIGLEDLDRMWTREAVFLWRDFESVTRRADWTRAWAREALARLGYGSGPDLAETVSRFQKDAHLVADGLIGARTLLALYSLGPYPRPRLRMADSAGASS